MSLFAKKVAAATPSDNTGIWFEVGQYPLIQVDAIKLITSKKPGREGTELLVLTFDILDSRVDSRPAGMTGVSHTLNSAHPGAADDAKRFVLALFPNVDPKAIDDQALIGLASPTQPAHGRLLSLECYNKKSEKTGKDFTKHIFKPVPEELQAQAKELRARVGLPTF